MISARDNPNNMADSKMEKTEVIINILSEDNLVVLTVKNSSPGQLSPKSGRIAEIIQDQTGLLVDIHQVHRWIEIF